MAYLSLVIAVIVAVGISLIYWIFSLSNIDVSYTNCTGNCNQGRNCDCKDID